MNISIIIPNYNGEHLLKKNLPRVLRSVQSYDKGSVEIIIPDDPSTDKSEEVIREFIHSLQGTKIVGKTVSNRNKKLAGFSHNVNRGVSLSTGDILILLNSDVIPYEGFLTPLLTPFADESVFAVGCLDETEESGKIVLRGRGIGSWKKGFLMHAAGNITKKNTLWASGGSSAFRKTIWDTLGGMDTLYDPFYWEDIDLSYRALKAGYVVSFASNSRVKHEHEKGVIQTKFSSKKVTEIAYRNQFIFVWKNITQKKLLLDHIRSLPYHCMRAAIRGDWVFFVGFISALKQLPKVKKARKKVKKFFIRTDESVLKDFTQ